MIKYAKVINENTGLCDVGLGTNATFYTSIGMISLDVEQSEIDNQWYLAEKCPHYTEAELVEQERNRLDMLSLTKADVLLALYEDKGITPDNLKTMLADNVPALIKFDYASSYYRGDEVVNALGLALGYTTEEMDYLFENKAFPTVEETEEETPEADTEQEEDTETPEDVIAN